MSTELFYLTLTVLLTGVLWIPYILALIGQIGLGTALMDTQHEFHLDKAWARRSQRVHTNAVENLVIFAAVVIAVELSGTASSLTAGAALVYFLSRIAHAVVYLAGVPIVRTVLFFIGFVCQMVIGLAALSAV